MKSLFPILLCSLLSLPADAQTGLLSSSTYTGMCDASAAMALGPDRFVVANDEDNILRIYSLAKPGRELATVDLSSFLSDRRKSPESDIEGAARIGNRIYWITSHALNSSGKDLVHRQRLFATEVVGSGAEAALKPAGTPYANLKRDLLRSPKLKPFNLEQAVQTVPDQEGGWNIEGLAATPEGHLLVAFRNPIPKGKALVVPVSNPAELVAGNASAAIGDPILLDLGGLGIRSLELHHGRYLIVAGHHDKPAPSRLYIWRGGADAPRALGIDLTGLNAEGTVFPEVEADPATFHLISDDGAVNIGNRDCKDLKDAGQKRFRSFGVRIDWPK